MSKIHNFRIRRSCRKTWYLVLRNGTEAVPYEDISKAFAIGNSFALYGHAESEMLRKADQQILRSNASEIAPGPRGVIRPGSGVICNIAYNALGILYAIMEICQGVP